ncbi:aminotransferase class I and II [Methanolacinia petrolearia DSM 11571]|uniref:Aminotransferase class I and II n=1 Tax=Methanolacinia petrolearia (strain DSM 11571 / OCM 486 / SEBR 4847) TaxID=679926 RepID=E1RHJ8_METP4|nr:aminotransferase class I/II-fold pyridoxal phosphate-dependent enzyme [Methanolacinia petrolearia]ADN35307.1 aminotransferase class I and II [Methanolacinia petrolearia DSM 11571]
MRPENFLLEKYMGIYEFSAPYLLCTSDCETITVSELLSFEEGAEAGLMDLRLGYTEARGGKELREEISKLYGNISPDDVITFAGAEEGIFIFMNAVLSKGDHVIVQFPAYQSLYEIAEAIGCEVTLWEMKEEDGWKPDPDFLVKNIRKNTKAIIINSPHNPTGFNFPKEDFGTIVNAARENDLYLFSDEVYRQLEFDPGTRLPAAADLYEKGFSLGVMSKAFGLAGLRSGWIAARNRETLEKISSLKDYTTICSSAPSEYLAAVALRHSDRLVDRSLGIIKKNLEILDPFMERHSDLFEWVRPVAASIGFVKLKNGVSATDFCKKVVDETGVLLMPSTVYGFGDSHFRVGFGREDMEQCLEKFEIFLKNNY